MKAADLTPFKERPKTGDKGTKSEQSSAEERHLETAKFYADKQAGEGRRKSRERHAQSLNDKGSKKSLWRKFA